MNKARLEALSDGVFAIVLTLLVLEIKVPEAVASPTSADLSHELAHLSPVFLAYIVTAVVISMLWVGHHALFHFFAKNINRVLVQLNMLYLSLVALIPFSAHLLGEYPDVVLAVVIYGGNILLITLVSLGMVRYALNSKEIDTAEVTPRMMKQAMTRQILTPLSTALGMLVATVSIPIALVLYAFPIIFNIIPGTLDFVERILGIEIR